MIFYKVYTSTPTAAPRQEIIDQITEESKRWNSKHGITGMLLCMEDRFFQFLEGDEKDVDSVFNKIKADSRHTEVYVRIKGYGTDRIFKEWSMGSWTLTNEELSNLSAIADLKDYMSDSENKALSPKKFISMMQNILDTWLAHEPERSKRLKG